MLTATSEALMLIENRVSTHVAPTINSFVQMSPQTPHIVYTPSLATIGTQTDTTMSQHLKISSHDCVAMLQLPVLSGNRKK